MSDTMIKIIAQACHEANRAYCLHLGDDSQKPWSEAPDWQRASAVNGVVFHLGNPEAGDSASHDNWMAEKVASGWVHGETKDETKKTHPCIVPFDQLPPAQQFKDALFRSIVHGAASAVDVVGRLAADFEEVSKQRDLLTSDLAETKAALAKASKGGKAKVAAAPKVAKLRAAGPLDKPVDVDALLKAVQERPHVLVFSDGETELAALDAVMIQGAAAWRRRGRGVLLAEPVRVKPNVPVELAGFGLLDSRGRQVAWAPLSQPLRIAAGQEVKLDSQVLFG